jgi:hypothetical protein
MKALSKRLLRLTLFAIATTSLFSVRPVQAYTVRLHQVGSNVVATGSGPINLTGLTFTGLSSSAAGMNPSIADLAVATGLQDQYQGFSGPLSFGPGGITFANSNSGDAVTLISGMTSFSGLFVPQGYVSGGALSSSSTYNNATFASLGVTPGTYVWSWGQGANQRFTLIIGGVGVPDAGSTLPLLGFGLLGLAALRRKLSR